MQKRKTKVKLCILKQMIQSQIQEFKFLSNLGQGERVTLANK